MAARGVIAHFLKHKNNENPLNDLQDKFYESLSRWTRGETKKNQSFWEVWLECTWATRRAIEKHMTEETAQKFEDLFCIDDSIS